MYGAGEELWTLGEAIFQERSPGCCGRIQSKRTDPYGGWARFSGDWSEDSVLDHQGEIPLSSVAERFCCQLGWNW